MGSITLIDPITNTWRSDVQSFNVNVANNFYSYGFPSYLDQIQQGGGGQRATVVFQSEDFFTNIVDADRGLDMNNLAPSDFSFVSNLFNGNTNLTPGFYSVSELRDSGVAGLSITGSLYDWGSNFGNSRLRDGEVGLAIGSYRVDIVDSAVVVVGTSNVSILNFGYQVAPDNYDFVSSNVPAFVNGLLSVVNGITKPFGFYEQVQMEYEGWRSVGLVTSGSYQTGYSEQTNSVGAATTIAANYIAAVDAATMNTTSTVSYDGGNDRNRSVTVTDTNTDPSTGTTTTTTTET